MQTFGFDKNKNKRECFFLVFCVAIFPRKAIKINSKVKSREKNDDFH